MTKWWWGLLDFFITLLSWSNTRRPSKNLHNVLIIYIFSTFWVFFDYPSYSWRNRQMFYLLNSLNLWHEVLYLHNVIRYEVYTCAYKMLFKPWGIDIYTSGCLWSCSCLRNENLKNITFQNCSVPTKIYSNSAPVHNCSW